MGCGVVIGDGERGDPGGFESVSPGGWGDKKGVDKEVDKGEW